jgi:hypothetical protein
MLTHDPEGRPKCNELSSLLDAAIAGTLPSVATAQHAVNLTAVARVIKSSMHAGSERLARLICAESANAKVGSELLNLVLLRNELGMEQNEFNLAVDELEARHFVSRDEVLGGAYTLQAAWELFFDMDPNVKGWNANEDSIAVARALVAQPGRTETSAIAEHLGWTPRRMNPACGYLVLNRKVKFRKPTGVGPLVYTHLMPADPTMRLARDGY